MRLRDLKKLNRPHNVVTVSLNALAAALRRHSMELVMRWRRTDELRPNEAFRSRTKIRFPAAACGTGTRTEMENGNARSARQASMQHCNATTRLLRPWPLIALRVYVSIITPTGRCMPSHAIASFINRLIVLHNCLTGVAFLSAHLDLLGQKLRAPPCHHSP